MLDLSIKYSVGNANGGPSTSRELVITNWESAPLGQLF
jgi:DNA adenine methylase